MNDKRERVDPQLWKAVMDFSSGLTYRWDPAAQAVVTFDSHTERSDLPRIPTIDRDELLRWSERFQDEHRDEVVGVEERIARWRQRGLGAANLPGPLRGAWYEFLRGNVVNVLEQFFTNSVDTSSPTLLTSPADPDEDELRQLRRFLIACVGEMTLNELQELRVPARAAARVRSRS